MLAACGVGSDVFVAAGVLGAVVAVDSVVASVGCVVTWVGTSWSVVAAAVSATSWALPHEASRIALANEMAAPRIVLTRRLCRLPGSVRRRSARSNQGQLDVLFQQ